MRLFAHRTIRHRRHRPLFAAGALLTVLGLFVLGGVAAGVTLFAATALFVVGCVHRLSGEKPVEGEFGWYISS